MKVSLSELNLSHDHLAALARQTLPIGLCIPISQALAVAEAQQKIITKALNDMAQLRGFRLSARRGELPQLIEADANGSFDVSLTLIEEFNAEAEKYLSGSFVQVPVKKIARAELEKGQAQLTAEGLLRLGWLFDVYSNEATEEAEKAIAATA